MSRFTFSGTNTGDTNAPTGPTVQSLGTNSLNILQFPGDLFGAKARDDTLKVIHVMLIYINTPAPPKYEYGGRVASPEESKALIAAAGLDYFKEVGVGTPGDVGAQFDRITTLGGTDTSRIRLPRSTAVVKTVIALPMPEQYANDTRVQYKDWDLFSGGRGLLGDMAATIKAGFGSNGPAIWGSVGSLAKSILTTVGAADLADAALQGVGYAQNPQTEVLFESVPFREFTFDYKFTPRSKYESDNLRKIVLELRRWQVPELLPNTVGRLFVTPAFFTLKFLRVIQDQGEENVYVQKISACALTNLVTDYAPDSGWSAHHDGSPTSVRMTLSFKEIEFMHRARIDQGY